MTGEKGQVLPLVLVALAVGTLLISPFLTQASANLLSSRDYGIAINEQYSAGSGVEHAIWGLVYDDLASGVPCTYTGETINGVEPEITVTKTGSSTYSITSIANGNAIKAEAEIVGGNVSILSWQVE